METKKTLEERINDWRNYISRRKEIKSSDVEELEDHLRTQVDVLKESGLDDDEAFLVAVKRLGDIDSISREFAREYSERLWKQLVLLPETGDASFKIKKEAIIAVALAAAAAVAIKLPALFNMDFNPDVPMSASFYARNFSLFVLPFLAVFFAWKRSMDPAGCLRLAAVFALSALAINILPYKPVGHTEMLAAMHLPIALWVGVGFAYTGGRWNDHGRRMNFIRFSGEWVIYFALIAFGGGVLILFTVFVFSAIGFEVEWLVQSWLMLCGSVGAVIISAWLVEAKQSIIENMAPVLTRLFTPLFTALLLAFLVTMIWTGRGINIEREVLIGFDLLLVVVLGLLLYSISARDQMAAPGLFDRLQLLLVLSALLVDVLALWAIAARISEFGFSPNKVAALGENIILLVNLAWSAVLYMRFLTGRASFAPLERWQTAYLPVYAVWAGIVVIVFPVIFNYQ